MEMKRREGGVYQDQGLYSTSDKSMQSLTSSKRKEKHLIIIIIIIIIITIISNHFQQHLPPLIKTIIQKTQTVLSTYFNSHIVEKNYN